METRLIFRIEYKRLHEEKKKTKHRRQPSLYTQFSQIPYVLLLIPAQLTYVPILTYVLITTYKDPALTTPWGLDRQRRLPWERALLLALPAYSHFPVSSHFRPTHAPLIVTLPVYSQAARTHTSGVLTRHSSFSRYPSRPAWSRRGPLTRLTWACCSHGIRHA